jgi:hypothetical protein
VFWRQVKKLENSNIWQTIDLDNVKQRIGAIAERLEAVLGQLELPENSSTSQSRYLACCLPNVDEVDASISI